jgi:AcrR family transcriptional regulator
MTRSYGELTVEQVVDAAVDVCRREGLGALTMRKLASELGLSSMNAYYYVASKAELLDLVADAVLGEVPAPPDEAAGWEDQLTFLFREARAVLLRYPGVSDHLLVRSQGHPGQERLGAMAGSILRGAAVDRRTAVRTQRVFTYLLLGAVSQELATAAAEEDAATIRFADDEEVFDYGLALLVDGLAAGLARRKVTK